jgi:hypothetical protein
LLYSPAGRLIRFFRRSRDAVKDTEQGAVCMKDLDPGFPDQILWFLVPSAASLFDLFVDVTILIASQPIPTTSSMLNQQDLPVHFADPPNFLKRADGIKERTGRAKK